MKLLKCYALKQIVASLYRRTETLIDLSEVEKQYIELLDSYNIAQSSHITNFFKSLQNEIPDLVDHLAGRKKYVSYKRKLDRNFDTLVQPEVLYDLIAQVAQQIREKLDNVMYEFVAPNVIPPELTIIIDSIINRGRTYLELGFSLPVETIAQLIVYNHRSRKASKLGISGTMQIEKCLP